jgi:hypothetical protein
MTLPVFEVLNQGRYPRERTGRPIPTVHHRRRFEGVVERRFGEDIQRGIGRAEPFD